jgi:HAD superfamily hydrolase (TIGR01509 family)
MSPHGVSPATDRTPAFPAAALFDMDGLLIDTEPIWFGVESDIMTEHGGTWTSADHAVLVGTAMPVSSAFISERIGGRLSPDEVASELLDRMTVRLRDAVFQPGARRLLDELHAAGIPTALVSSSAGVLVTAALQALAPLRFDAVVAGDTVERHKPHPEPYLRAADLLGVDPADCVAFEDSPVGAESALAAGCAVVAVPSVTAISASGRLLVVDSLDAVHLEALRCAFVEEDSRS